MAAYSYRVTLANGQDGFFDSDVPVTPEELQAATAQVDQHDQTQAQAANARAQADQQAGRGASYLGTAGRNFVAPLAGSVRGVGEMLDSPSLVRGGNELEQDTASYLPTNPTYANELPGKVIGSTAGLAGGVLPFAVPFVGPEALGPASVVAQTYDSGLREGLNAGLPLSTAQDYAKTHVALQAPLMIAGGRVVRGLIGGESANVLPTLSNRLSALGTGALEAGGIGSASQLASNLQAGNTPLVGYNIDPNRGALDDVLSSGALMAGSAGLLGLPGALLRGRVATPTVDTASSAPSVAPVVPDPAAASTPDTTTPTPPASGGTTATPPADTTDSLPQNVLPDVPAQPSFLSPLANKSAADSASFLAGVTPTDSELTSQLYRQQEQAQATAAAADRQVNVLARIRAAAQAQAEKNAATLDAVSQASQTADQAEASAAPLTAQALRQNAQETLATASPQTSDATTIGQSGVQNEQQVESQTNDSAQATPQPVAQDATLPELVAKSPLPIEPFRSPIAQEQTATPTPLVDTGAPTPQASTETPSPTPVPAESSAPEAQKVAGTSTDVEDAQSSPESTQAGTPEQAPRLDDRGLPITTIESDPTEAMRASPDVEASGDTVKELPPKEQTYGSRVNTDYFHLPQERSEYTRETAELVPHENEADLLTQANTALQRRRYEVENKVGGYEGRGGTNAVDRVLSATYLKYLRNLREGTSGKDGFKASEVGQVLNNVIRDFQKGASKRKTTVALDAPTAEGGRTVGDSVPDDAPTPSEAAARSDAVGRMRTVTQDFSNTLDRAGKEQLNSLLERVAHGEPPHEMSADDIDLYDRFIAYAQPKFHQAELSASRNLERGEGAPPLRTSERTATEDASPAERRAGSLAGSADDSLGRGEERSAGQSSRPDQSPADEVEDGALDQERYTAPRDGQRYLDPRLNDALDDALTQALPTLRRLGIGIEENVKSAGRGAAAGYNALGEVSLEVNRAGLAKGVEQLTEPGQAEAYIRAGVSEEITHLADIANERDAWNASGRKGGFTEFVRDRKRAVLNGINSDLAKANPRTKAVLQTALLDGWNLYHDTAGKSVVDAEGAKAKAAAGDTGFSFEDPAELHRFLADHPDQVTGYMMETLRQLVQLRETDPSITTEVSYVSMLERFQQFVERVLNKLRQVAADPKAYSQVLADAINQIERVKNGQPLDFIPRIRAELPEVRPVDRETVRANLPETNLKSEPRDPDKAVHDFVETLTGIKPPATPREKLELPSAREKAREVAEGAKTAGGRILQAVRKIGDIVPLTDKDVLLRRLSYNEQINDQNARSIQESIERAVPDKKAREAIDVYRDLGGDKAKLQAAADNAKKSDQKARYERALNLSPDELKVAGALDNLYKSIGQDAVERGHLTNLRENYANRYVNRPFLERLGLDPATGGGSGRFTKNFRAANERSFETIPDVEQSGRTLDSYDAAELAARYVHEYGKLKLTEQLFNDAKQAKASDGRPLVDVRSDPPELSPNATDAEFEAAKQATRHDYVPTGAQGVFGNLAFHPEATRANGRSGDIRNIFKTSAISKYLNAPSSNLAEAGAKLTLAGVRKAQNIVRSTMLDLGIFHGATEGVHALGHGINPLAKFESFDPTNARHQEALASGLQIIPRIGSEKQFASDMQAGSDSLLRKVPGVSQLAEKMSHALFEGLIPSLKLRTFQAVLDRNLERAKPDIDSGRLTRQDVAAHTAEQVNNGYGHQSYTSMARNPTMQDLFRIFALAPDFLESRYKFAKGALQGLAGKAGAREELRTFAALALGQIVITRAFNKLADDDYHWDHPFSFVKGNRAYTLRSVPEDLLAALTDAPKFAAGRESPLTRTAIQLLTGRNYRGERVTAGETLQEAATSGVPISLKGLPGFDHLNTTQRNQVQSWTDRFFNFAGINARRLSPEESLYTLANKYKESQGIKEDTGSRPTSIYTPVRNALADGDTDRAGKELQSIYASSGKTRTQILQALQASLLHPFTQSRGMDQQFFATLTPDQLSHVRAAQQQRQQLLGQARALVAALPAAKSPALPSPQETRYASAR